MKNTENMVICRCEEVTIKDLVDTAKKYQCSSRELKLRTRAAMGYCGGRTCRPLIDQLTQEISDQPSAQKHPLNYRPPIRPISFEDIGGESN